MPILKWFVEINVYKRLWQQFSKIGKQRMPRADSTPKTNLFKNNDPTKKMVQKIRSLRLNLELNFSRNFCIEMGVIEIIHVTRFV